MMHKMPSPAPRASGVLLRTRSPVAEVSRPPGASHSLRQVDKAEAIRSLSALHNNLQSMVDRSEEQEVEAWVLPLLDAVLTAARDLVPAGHPVLDVTTDLISPATIEAGAP